MGINLLNLVKDQLTDGVLDKVSGLMDGGEDKSAVQKGLMTAAPALLASFMDKASSEQGASSVMDMLGDGSELNDLSGALSGGESTNGLLGKGTDMVNSLLGDKASGVLDMVSSLSGLSGGSSSKVLGLAGSVIGGVLGKQKASGLDAGGLMNLLSGQGEFLEKTMPSGLTSILGLGSLSDLGSKLGALTSGTLNNVVSGASNLTGDAAGKVIDIGKGAVDAAGNALSGAADLAGNTAGKLGDVGKGAVGAAGNVLSGAADLAGNTAGKLGDVGKGAVGAAGNVLSGAADLAGDTAGKLGDVGKGAMGAAGSAVSGAADLAGGAAAAGGSLLKKIIPIAIGAIALIAIFFFVKGCGEGKGIGDSLNDAVNDTKGTVTSASGKVTDATSGVIESAGDVVKDVAGSVTDAAGDAVNEISDAAKSAAANAASFASATVGSLFSWGLPNGEKLNIPKGGFENNLLEYLQKGELTPGKYYAFDRIYFDTGSANLSVKSLEQISNVAGIMKAYPEVKFLFRGHTDNKGSRSGNESLSKKRAEGVKAAIVAKDISENRISTSGMASAEPIATNDTEEGRSQNRRIDVSIIK